MAHPLVVMDYRDYWYWFTLLYCSINASKSSNILILSGFIFPAFINFLLAFNQLSISCSSIRCFNGFRLLVSINVFISLYLANQRSSCFIEFSQPYEASPHIPLFYYLPIYDLPECGEVSGSAVLVVDIIGMFPYIEGQKRFQALNL